LEAAERHRKAQAIGWLGKELPPWPEPCPLHVKITLNGTGGATSFAFENGKILSRNMNLEGSLDRILVNCLPHEVAHTVLADHFRTPLPRWADEGAAVLSEDEEERERHGKLAMQIARTPGRLMALRRLFALRDFPQDVMVLYAQGYAVTQYLVDKKDRKTFLKFVKQGMDDGWDKAVQTHYGYRNVEALEDEWLTALLGPAGRSEPVTDKERGFDRGREKVKESAAGVPRGAAPSPVTTLAVMRADGSIVLRWPVEFYQPVERKVRRENGEGEMSVTYYERFGTDVRYHFNPSHFQVFDTKGKPVKDAAVREVLKNETAVLVAADNRQVDPFHLQLIKEGTLVLVPKVAPPAPPWTVPVPAPLAPPPVTVPIPSPPAPAPPPAANFSNGIGERH
jgi:hypothetical protein